MAHGILEIRLCSGSAVQPYTSFTGSDHLPDGGCRYVSGVAFDFFLLIFLGETGSLLLRFLLPPTRILGILRLEVGPAATAVVLKVRRRFRLFRRSRRRALGGASASARALASSSMF